MLGVTVLAVVLLLLEPVVTGRGLVIAKQKNKNQKKVKV